jgi:NitT/TauT family transport system substrate-binding protein
MKKTTIGIIIICVVVIIGIGIYSLTHKQPEKYSGPVEKIIVGSPLQGISSLVYLAQDNGYFKENKLDVEIIKCSSGLEAVQKLLDGEIDIALGTDFVFTSNSFDHDNLRVIGSIAKADVEEFVMRKDSGISSPENLKGKKIGIKRKSSTEYHLGSFLVFNGLTLDDIEMIDLSPAELFAALQNNEVDAIITWPPYAFNVKNQLGDNALSWSAQSGHEFYWIAITTQDKIPAKELAFEKFLTALVQSEEYVNHNNAEAKKIITKYLDTNEKYMNYHWPKHKFFVELPQTLLIKLDSQARWRIQNNLTQATEIPNYMNFLYLEALDNVKPEVVTIIR